MITIRIGHGGSYTTQAPMCKEVQALFEESRRLGKCRLLYNLIKKHTQNVDGRATVDLKAVRADLHKS